MRPSAEAASTGSRAPAIRLLTSAVRNTVLPERERPVTPSRKRPAGKIVAERAGDQPGLEHKIGEKRQGMVRT